MSRSAARAVVLAAAMLLAACGDKGSPADPPTDVSVVAGENSATVTWTPEPGVEYWLFYAPAPEITRDNWYSLFGSNVIKPAVPPVFVAGLANGVTYSFMVNGRVGGGPGGAGSPSVPVVPRLAGSVWTPGTPTGTLALRGLTYGARYLAVGDGGAIYASTDATSWSSLVSGVSSALNAVLYGGVYFAAGAQGAIVASTDGSNWAVQSSGTTSDLYALATNFSGTFVAVGAGGTIVVSPDRLTWSAAASSGQVTTRPLYGAAYAFGKYVAVGEAGTLLTSADASTWTPQSSGTSADLRSVAYGAGLLVAVGANGTLVTSPDGDTWTAQPALGAAALNSVAYGRQFIAVGDGGAVYTSADGLTWQAQTSGTTQALYAVAPGIYSYLAVGEAGLNLLSR